jgi:hypothetical protein
LAQLGGLRGRVENAIAELTDIADIIGAMARMFAPSKDRTPVVAKGYTDLESIDLDHDLGVRDQHGPFGEE